ncbi:MAG: PD40 domain-containing protein [Flavobacteriales bacterium]|nr:PD40 domain-containing protein [Flavobacteriales bacterium]
MKRILFFYGIVLISLSLNAQSQMGNYYFQQGKVLYEDDDYEAAIEQFEKALEKDATHGDALCYLGYSYSDIGKHAKAVEAFNRLEQSNPDYSAWYFYIRGNSNIEIGDLENASIDFQKFLDGYSQKPNLTVYHHKAAYKLNYAKQSIAVRKLKNSMPDPVNLGSAINSVSDDMMPQIDPTGTRLYFTSNRKGGLDKVDEDEENDWGEDLYFVEKVNGQWSVPKLLPEPINSYDNDGTSTFSADGQEMIYVKCGDDEGIGSCDLYLCELNGNEWSKPINLGNVVNNEEWDSQPCLASDGQTLAFVSGRKGTYNESMDIFISRKNKFGQWGVPENLGPIINTPFGEKSPYLAPDGKTLYFASEGHPGYGSYDLFVSVFENGRWSSPKNLGAPLNSSGEDTYFTISASGESAFFASNRGGAGKLDIYSIDLPDELRPKPSVIVKGEVKNAKNNEYIDAWVLVEDINTGELIATAKSNSETGEYLVVLPSGRNYSVSANKEGFFFYSNKFEVAETAKYEEFIKHIKLEPIEKGARVVLNNIFFETGSAVLTQDSYIELGKAVELLKANSKMVVEVGGHTDNVGSDDANMQLSHERAKSVRDYLVKAGIKSEKLQAKGYGETQPVADNETEEGRKTNRRTEFVILEN